MPAPLPSLKELELPEHVNVLFLQTVDEIDLPQDTVQGLKLLLYDHRDTFEVVLLVVFVSGCEQITYNSVPPAERWPDRTHESNATPDAEDNSRR